MDFASLLNTIITLFILMSVGFILSKIGIIDEVASKRLSKIIIVIGQPCLIIGALVKMKYSADQLGLGLATAGFGIIVHIIMALISFIACKPFRNLDERKLTEFAMIFGNVGFIGFPILQSLFGDRGLFMGSFFIVSFNLVLWTWGIAILARKRDDIKLTVKKVLINYGTIPCAIGVIIYILNLDLPTNARFLYDAITYIGNLCTPISTIIIGALLARRSLLKLFTNGKIYYLSLMKLIVIPAIICLIMKLIGFNSDLMLFGVNGTDWTLFMVAVCCMPSATTVTMLAEVHDISPAYSAQAVGMNSLLSIISMPIVMKIAEFIMNI